MIQQPGNKQLRILQLLHSFGTGGMEKGIAAMFISAAAFRAGPEDETASKKHMLFI